MRRRQKIMGSLLGACLILAGCGQALQLQPANTGAQPTSAALDGAPQASAPGSITVEPSAAGGIGVESAPPIVEGAASAAPDTGAGDTPADGGAPAPTAEVAPTAAPEPTIDPAFNGVTLPGAAERWRYVQQDRTPLDGVQTYTTPGRQILWWYDPSLGRTIRLGEIQGDFPVQATFRFRGQEVDALEVPYQVNQSFGITIPGATVEEIQKAGYGGDWIEAFVYKTDDIRPK